MSQTALYLSDNTLTATLTDAAGDAVTGGTGTVTVVDSDGTVVDGPDALVEPSPADGTYTYAVPYNLMTKGDSYVARVTFTAPGNRYAEITIHCTVDED